MLKIDPSAQASMLDDLEKGRSTEVDYINGEIIKLAQSVGAQTPLNNKALTLIKQAEQNKQGSPKIALDELLGVLNS